MLTVILTTQIYILGIVKTLVNVLAEPCFSTVSLWSEIICFKTFWLGLIVLHRASEKAVSCMSSVNHKIPLICQSWNWARKSSKLDLHVLEQIFTLYEWQTSETKMFFTKNMEDKRIDMRKELKK